MNADRFLDTSVVVRYLTDDPPDAAHLARQIIDGVDALTLTDVVLIESLYVLTSVYKIPRGVVVDQLVRLVAKENITVFALDKDTVIHGLLLCRRSGRVSISDAMIWAAARSANASTVFSFDRRFPTEGVTCQEAP